MRSRGHIGGNGVERSGRRHASRAATVLLAVLVLGAGGARAQQNEPDPRVLERLEALERRLAESERERGLLEQKVERLQEAELEREEAGMAQPPVDGIEELGPVARRARQQQQRLGLMGGLYAKPFLVRMGGAYVGGYVDVSYRDTQGESRRFVQQRFIPFIFSEVTETIRFGAEIEFEYGGPDFARGNGEIKIEYAAVDWEWSEAIGLRAGAILVPLGKFNLVHDSPVNDLTDRPLVDRLVIPTTFPEAGFGFFGTLYPGGQWQIDYQIYATNGFVGIERDPAAPSGWVSNISRDKGLRSARPGMKFDGDNSVAVTGRIALSPMLGTEFGLSWHVGSYGPGSRNRLGVYALDWTIQAARFSEALAGFELLGELAWADIGRDRRARAAGVPDDLWGLYAQIGYHFMFDALREALPSIFGPESTFTAVTRFGHVDLDGNRTQRWTLGLNYRPVEDTVFKIEYQFNFEDGKHTLRDNDTFAFSVATYF